MSEAIPVHERRDDEIAELWGRFKADGDPQAREGLILHFAPLVKFVAGRVGAGLPRSVDRGDLVSYGTIGLIDAVDKFEPERGYKFQTYAVNRIRGAILDELRSQDWVPRSVRSRAREIQRSMMELEHRLQRSPSEGELADFMEVPVEKLRGHLDEIASLGFVSLDDPGTSGDGASAGIVEVLEDRRATDPGAALEEEETRTMLTRFVERLPERERVVVSLYYFEGLTLREIGSVLDVTESRVSQIHAKAMLSLKNRFIGA